MLTPLVLHDVNCGATYAHQPTIARFWKMRHNVSLADATFHGYWFSDAVKSGSPGIYVSWYSWEKKPSPYTLMLVVGNVGRTPQKAMLKLDMPQLGLIGKSVEYYDIWNNHGIATLDALEVPANDFLLIGIK